MALPGRAVRAAAPPPGRHRSRESNLRSAHCTEGAVRTSPWPRPATPGTPPIAPGPRPAPSGAHGVLAKRGPAGTLHVATAAPTVLQPLMCPQHRAADASSTTGARGPGPPNDAVKRRLVFQPPPPRPGTPMFTGGYPRDPRRGRAGPGSRLSGNVRWERSRRRHSVSGTP